jgi:peptidoglycan/LPS O-acetylase OafA/YrhL
MKRIPQLHLLRSIAVLLVLRQHYPYFYFTNVVGWAGHSDAATPPANADGGKEGIP